MHKKLEIVKLSGRIFFGGGVEKFTRLQLVGFLVGPTLAAAGGVNLAALMGGH